jgi:adenylate cyclase
MKKLIKVVLSPWLALVTMLLMLSIRVADPSFVESVRLRYFDQLITSKGTTVSEQIHVVNIDDETIRQKGQFPFPRGEYSKLITDLYNAGAGLVVFNVYMPERDRFNQDLQLAETFKQLPVVIPHIGTTDNITNKFTPFRPGVSVIGGENAGVNYGNIEPNIKMFNNSAAGIGVVNTLPEIDGVTRRVPMVVQANGQLYPSISLETLRVASGDPSFQVKVSDGNIEAVRIPKFGKITTDELGRIWVDWSSKHQQHSAVSLPKNFNGGIVIVGITAKGLNNPVASPIGAVYPHHLQAAVLETVISGTNISRPFWAFPAELAFVIVSGILSLLFITRFTHGYFFALILGFSTYWASSELFSRFAYLTDAVYPLLALLIVCLHGYVVKFITELRAKLQIKKQFGTYLSPALVEKLQRHPELLKLGGETKTLTFMFSDIRGFTPISEQYKTDPQGLTQLINRFLTPMTNIIMKNEGTIDKYMGDCIMAFWNAPLDTEKHEQKALQSAIDMLKHLETLNEELVNEGKLPISIGIGINSGECVVGNMGSDQRFDYSVLGDAVNLASRLEGQSKGYGVTLIIGSDTRTKLISDQELEFPELDLIAVKGKTEPARIFTAIGREGYEASSHQSFIESYYEGNFREASKKAKNLIKEGSKELTHYYEIMLERIEDLISHPPKQWDGVYRATSK